MSRAPQPRPKRAGVWENLGPSLVDLPQGSTSAREGGSGADRGSSMPARRALTAARVWLFGASSSAPRRFARAFVRAGTLAAVLLFAGLHLLGALGLVALPSFFKSSVVMLMLVVLVLHVINQTYAEALRSLAFYGRFIRPGLKRLLEQERGRGLAAGEKVFRGRKTVIMKIDMAHYTRTTFTMPYGMRRLFQDLWFTLIDQVVADKVFLDKSLGDGSVYCFEDGLPGGSATVALETALAIRDRQVRRFDEIFRDRLREKLAATPELRERAEVYLHGYEERLGESFWQRRTQVRIALVSGYVDEGLWGLSAQSHYDVHGNALVLATRLEAGAHNGEIVFDQAFLDELEEESPGRLDTSRLERRCVELKGIGSWEVLALPAEQGFVDGPRGVA